MISRSEGGLPTGLQTALWGAAAAIDQGQAVLDAHIAMVQRLSREGPPLPPEASTEVQLACRLIQLLAQQYEYRYLRRIAAPLLERAHD
jgi:hypothetical protein